MALPKELENALNQDRMKLEQAEKKKEESKVTTYNSRYSKAEQKRILSRTKKNITSEEKQYRSQVSRLQGQIKELEAKKKVSRLQSSIRYQASKSGKVSSGISRAIRFVQSPTRYRAFPQRVNRGIQNISNNVTAVNQNKDFFDWCFSDFSNPRHDVAGQVEKEVSGSNINHANIGDALAFNIGNEALHNSKLQTKRFNPVKDVDFEVMANSNFQHLAPIVNVENEVMAFANILTPRQPKSHKRRR